MPKGRLAGALYLVVVVTGIFSLAYVPSQVSINGDVQAAISHITASEQLFRFGIASLLINQVAFLVLPLALFELLHGVNRKVAVTMVALAVSSVPIVLIGAAYRLNLLSLLADGNSQPILVQAQANSALIAYRSCLLVANLFWGLWLLPLGYLILQSRFLPRILGALLILGCVGYCVDVFGALVIPSYLDSAFSNYATLPAAIGEIGTALWLLVVGVRVPRRTAQPQL